MDTGNLLDSNEGILYLANIWGIRKGVDGTPGGLCGSIDYEESKELGTIKKIQIKEYMAALSLKK